MSMSEPNFVAVAAESEIEEKAFRCFKVGDAAILIARFRDELMAVENLCSHALATFDEGRMRGYRIMCPLHGATFDMRDGTPTAPATRPIKAYTVRVVNGMVEVDLSSGGEAPESAW